MPATISVPAKLIRRGNELKIAQHPEGALAARPPDPILVKLLAQAFASRDHLVDGAARTTVSDYSRRHLLKLARLAWLAPDIVSAIIEGRQPVHLTGRYLLRCGDIPLGWSEQRAFLGFS